MPSRISEDLHSSLDGTTNNISHGRSQNHVNGSGGDSATNQPLDLTVLGLNSGTSMVYEDARSSQT
jgi:hypothetical protein